MRQGPRTSDDLLGLRERIYRFSLRVIAVVRSLPDERVGWEIGKQLIRSGTSVCANVEEAAGGFSTSDFIFKLTTAYKEARETHMWLRMVRDAGLLAAEKMDTIIGESDELCAILHTSIRTARTTNNRERA